LGSLRLAILAVLIVIPAVLVLTFAGVGALAGRDVSQATASSLTTASGPSVPAAPMGVATPTGGWSVEYGDAFGSCLTSAATKCSLGGTRQDNTLGSVITQCGSGCTNRIAAQEPGQVNVSSSGLEERCDSKSVVPNSWGTPYTCAGVRGWTSAQDSRVTGATNPFQWQFGPNRHFVLQYSWKLPSNQGTMDDPATWSIGTGWAWEIDFPECWGFGSPAGQSNAWVGKNCGFVSVPKDTGGSTSQPWFPLKFDPSAAFHTWTLDFNDNASGTLTVTTYLDGVPQNTSSYANFNTTVGGWILDNQMRLNKTCNCDTGKFPAGGNVETWRYIAVYEPTSAKGAGVTHPGIAPGTSVG
jgi:hypothetical protein